MKLEHVINRNQNVAIKPYLVSWCNRMTCKHCEYETIICIIKAISICNTLQFI